MQRERIASDAAPAAIGPYSQAVKVGPWCILSGQIGLDPASGQMVEGGIEAQTRQVLRNLEAVLAAAGGSLADVISCRVYLMDLADFQVFNGIYGEVFGETRPARATVQVAGLPRSALVEIEAQAWLGNGVGAA